MKDFIEVTPSGQDRKVIIARHFIDEVFEESLYGYCRIVCKGESLYVKESYEELKGKLIGWKPISKELRKG